MSVFRSKSFPDAQSIITTVGSISVTTLSEQPAALVATNDGLDPAEQPTRIHARSLANGFDGCWIGRSRPEPLQFPTVSPALIAFRLGCPATSRPTPLTNGLIAATSLDEPSDGIVVIGVGLWRDRIASTLILGENAPETHQ